MISKARFSKSKLYLLPLYLFLPLVAVTILLGYSTMSDLEDGADKLVRDQRVKELALKSLTLVLAQDDATKEILLDSMRLGLAADRKVQAYDLHQEVLAELETLTDSSELLGLIARLRRIDEQELRPLDTQTLELALGGEREKKLDFYFNQYSPVRKTYEDLVRQLGDTAEAEALNAAQRIRSRNRMAFVRTSLVLIAGMLLAGTVMVLSGRKVGKRLLATARILEKVAEGDLRGRLEIASRDEVGRMAVALNRTLETLQRSMREIGDNASSLRKSSRSMDQVSQRLGANAQSTSDQARIVADAGDHVSNSVQVVASGVKAMSTSLDQIAGNAGKAAQVASSAVEVAESTSSRMAQLHESSQEIGNVVGLINAIAEQTKLLALNANIEAARAGGQAGKGFTVVANEVKLLARETGEATQKIAGTIQAIQGDTQGAVEAIGYISEIISETHQISQQIAAAVEEQRNTAFEITTGVNEAAGSTSDIARSISGVAEAAGSTSQSAGDTRQASGQLAVMAEGLSGLVEGFKC